MQQYESHWPSKWILNGHFLIQSFLGRRGHFALRLILQRWMHLIFRAGWSLIPVRSHIFHFGPIASNILSRASFGKAHQLALVVGPGCTGGCHPGCENHCQFVNLKRKNIEEEALAWIKLLYCNLQYWIALILIGWVIGWFWAHGKRR